MSAKRLAIGGALGLLSIIGSTGAVFALVERTSYLVGVRLAFSIVSTTGFGVGPQTMLGTVLMVGTFIAGACCWFTIVLACFQLGLKRYYESVGISGSAGLVADPWPSSIVPRGRG